jgi:hypothetical protein
MGDLKGRGLLESTNLIVGGYSNIVVNGNNKWDMRAKHDIFKDKFQTLCE